MEHSHATDCFVYCAGMTTQDQGQDPDDTSGISGFTFSEDWAAVVVGLAILLLALAGIITEDWLIL